MSLDSQMSLELEYSGLFLSNNKLIAI